MRPIKGWNRRVKMELKRNGPPVGPNLSSTHGGCSAGDGGCDVGCCGAVGGGDEQEGDDVAVAEVGGRADCEDCWYACVMG
jgi:hypothetical protein